MKPFRFHSCVKLPECIYLFINIPICEPWCWYIYLQNWVIYGVNVGKYSSTMGCIWDIYILYIYIYMYIIINMYKYIYIPQKDSTSLRDYVLGKSQPPTITWKSSAIVWESFPESESHHSRVRSWSNLPTNGKHFGIVHPIPIVRILININVIGSNLPSLIIHHVLIQGIDYESLCTSSERIIIKYLFYFESLYTSHMNNSIHESVIHHS